MSIVIVIVRRNKMFKEHFLLEHFTIYLRCLGDRLVKHDQLVGLNEPVS